MTPTPPVRPRRGEPAGLDGWQTQLWRAVRQRPGSSLRELQRATGISWTQTSRKIDELESRGIVQSVKVHRKERRVFPHGRRARDLERLAVLRWGRAVLVARLIRDRPGITSKEIRRRLGNLQRGRFLPMARDLKDRGLVREETRGWYRHYHPTPALGRLLDRLDRDDGAPKP